MKKREQTTEITEENDGPPSGVTAPRELGFRRPHRLFFSVFSVLSVVCSPHGCTRTSSPVVAMRAA